ncbi:hypothetical protein SEA_MORGANA_81 [Gordonia phage Morgana]|uniref:Uncharacterized protein n=1 Tax=Gordonia phage Morgana TaxID=3137292 RepID=A0AAX4RCW8_9CAUD
MVSRAQERLLWIAAVVVTAWLGVAAFLAVTL